MNDITIDKIKEQISAMLDGELSVQEQQLLLRRISADKALQQTFKRYQLIHDSMSNQLPSHIDTGFADRMHDLIDQEDESNQETVSAVGWRRRIIKPLTGIAVAATVAVVVLFTVDIQITPKTNSSDLIAGVSAADQAYRVNPMRWNTRTAEVGLNLNSYLVNHSEYTSSTNIQGMMQYVRIAGYDVEPKKKAK